MEFDYSKLRGRIVEKYGTITRFSDDFGITKSVMSRKLNGDTRFTSSDIIKIQKMLDVPQEEIGAYFFKEKVKEC